jgi:predicted enzyme related to lactoylglutathione lyase
MLTLVVPDYDDAIAHYVGDWGFELLEDRSLSPEKRWVRVAPKGSPTGFLLAKAANPDQVSAIGYQTGGRVFLFLHVDNLHELVAQWTHAGMHIEGPIRTEDYGFVCVVQDRYGNRWDVIQPA